MGVELAFGIAGGIILVGVLASLVSKRFGVPDIPLLIGLGVLLGPVTGLVQAQTLSQLAPAFAALAITVIVFEGGIHLRLARVAAQAGRATLLATVGFVVSVVAVGVAMAFMLGWPLLDGMLLGSALGGSSSVVVFSLLRRTKPSEKTGALLSLESSLTDVPTFVVTLSLVPIVLGVAGEGMFGLFAGIFQGFAIGGGVGIAAGVAWLRVLDKLEGEPYKDIATLGFLLGAYSVSQVLGGSGVMCALIMGIIMGNGKEVRKLANLGEAPLAEGISRRFHEQISFALTTFFFVYLGLYFSWSDPVYLLAGAAVSGVLFAARYVSVVVSTAGNSILKMDTWTMTLMYPRGLSNAIMGQVFITMPFALAEPLVQVLLSVILTSVLSASLLARLLPDHLSFNLRVPALGAAKLPLLAPGKDGVPAKAGLREAVRTEATRWLPGIGPDMEPVEMAFGSYEPVAAFSNGVDTAVIDSLAGLDEIKRIPSIVKICQEARFSGELDFVVDDFTAFMACSRLLLVEEYCNKSRSLGFAVRVYAYQPHARDKMVPLRLIRPSAADEPKKSRLGGVMDAVPRGASRDR